MKRSARSRTGLVLALAIPALVAVGSNLPAPAWSASLDEETLSTKIEVTVGHAASLDTGKPISRVSISNPDVAEPVAISPTQLLINGLRPGTATLYLWTQDGPPIVHSVLVRLDTEGLTEQFRTIFPGEKVEARASKNSIVLSGPVSNSGTAEKMLKLAEDYSSNVIDDMVSPGGTRRQIMLRVKFAEVGKTALEELGAVLHKVNPTDPLGHDRGTSGTGEFMPPGGNLLNDPIGPDVSFGDVINLSFFEKSIDLGAFITALKSRGLFQELAEPTLIAVDGEQANFLAGGEFPVPIAQPGAGFTSVTVSWKKFGISLEFKPTIKADDVIVMKVKPEVSSLDFVNAVLIEGFRIPSLTVRRFETEVELRDGQSFAIAGLYDKNLLRTKSKVPVLGDIPLLGYLFRSKNLSKKRTELLVIVTPTIVDAIDHDEELPTLDMPELSKPDAPV